MTCLRSRLTPKSFPFDWHRTLYTMITSTQPIDRDRQPKPINPFTRQLLFFQSDFFFMLHCHCCESSGHSLHTGNNGGRMRKITQERGTIEQECDIDELLIYMNDKLPPY